MGPFRPDSTTFTPRSPPAVRISGMIASCGLPERSPIRPMLGTPPLANGKKVGCDTMELRYAARPGEEYTPPWAFFVAPPSRSPIPRAIEPHMPSPLLPDNDSPSFFIHSVNRCWAMNLRICMCSDSKYDSHVPRLPL